MAFSLNSFRKLQDLRNKIVSVVSKATPDFIEDPALNLSRQYQQPTAFGRVKAFGADVGRTIGRGVKRGYEDVKRPIVQAGEALRPYALNLSEQYQQPTATGRVKAFGADVGRTIGRGVKKGGYALFGPPDAQGLPQGGGLLEKAIRAYGPGGSYDVGTTEGKKKLAIGAGKILYTIPKYGARLGLSAMSSILPEGGTIHPGEDLGRWGEKLLGEEDIEPLIGGTGKKFFDKAKKEGYSTPTSFIVAAGAIGGKVIVDSPIGLPEKESIVLLRNIARSTKEADILADALKLGFKEADMTPEVLNMLKETKNVEDVSAVLHVVQNTSKEAAEAIPGAINTDALQRKLTNLRELADANPFDEAVLSELKKTEDELAQITGGGTAAEVDPAVAAVQKQLNDVKQFSSGTAKIPEGAIPKRKPILQETTTSQEPLLRSPRTDIPLQKSEELSLEGSIPRQDEEVKERGLYRSLQEAENIPSEMKARLAELPEDSRFYDVYTDKEAIAKAEERITKSNDEALSFVLNAKTLDKDVATTGIALAHKYRQAGNIEMATEIWENLIKRGTQSGQGIQALSLIEKMSPDEVLMMATKRLQKIATETVPEKVAQLDTAIKEIKTKLFNVEKEVVEESTKNIKQLQIPDLEEVETTIKTKTQKLAKDAAERLAQRVKATTSDIKKPDAVTDMVNELYKVAREVLPVKKKPIPKNAIEMIGQAVNDRVTYREVWDKAQQIVREKYAGDKQALKLLDDYFERFLETPFSKKQLEKAVSQSIKTEEINLGKIVREHYSVVAEKRGSLVERLVREAGISEEQAVKLADQITTRFDELVKTKKESILNNIFKKRNIVDKTLVDRIIELSNLGGFESAKFRPLIAKKLGVPTLSEPLAKKLVEQAEKIQSLPFGYERFKAINELSEILARETPRTLGKKVYDWAVQILGSFKTLKSSFLDLSFGLRQGKVALYRHPNEWFKAWKAQFPAFTSEQGYEAVMDSVMKNPDFMFANQSGLSFTDINIKNPILREEGYVSTLPEKIAGLPGKIPIIGKYIPNPIRTTNRAYTAMANKLRMDTFSTLIKNAERAGKNPRADATLAKKIATHVNNMTGRGALPGKVLNEAQGLFNAVLYSPRLLASRINMLAPWEYIKADPFVRKEWLKTMLAFGSGTLTILGLAKLAGAEVGTDMRSADFGKIKVGNTRVDISGGYQQYFRMAAQLISGKYVSSSTGKVITLGEGYKPLTRWDILARQIESKESPLFAFITNILKQQDEMGEKVKLSKEMLNLVTPILTSDLYDLHKDDASLFDYAGFGLASFFGEGLQTYGPPEAYVKLNELRTAPDPVAAWKQLKKENPILADKVERAGIESTFNEFDWGLTYMGVENGERAQFLYQQLNNMKSDEERTALWTDLKKKKLLSKNVEKQLKWLYDHPDYQPPK